MTAQVLGVLRDRLQSETLFTGRFLFGMADGGGDKGEVQSDAIAIQEKEWKSWLERDSQ